MQGIRTENLVKIYRKRRVVDDLDSLLAEGEEDKKIEVKKEKKKVK